MTRNVDPRVYDPAKTRGAWISDDDAYRYSLWRCWDPTKPPMVFVMCNPSTADADEDDATIRKCIGFARENGYGGICVVNLYAVRSRDPRALRSHAAPIGPDNEAALDAALLLARGYGAVAAWGAVARDHGPDYQHRAGFLLAKALAIPVSLLAIKTTADGTPGHPLMLSYKLRPRPWVGR